MEPQYTLGWEHGYAAAHAGEPLLARPVPEPTKTTKVLAAGTLLVGLGGAVGLLLYQSKSPLREVAIVMGVSGLILSSVLAAVRVLGGEPTPQLGIQV